MTPLRQRMLDDLRIRNYSPSTVRAYVRSVADFAGHFHKSPEKLGPEEIRSYQLFLLNEKRVKLSTYIQAICALRFLYQNTLRSRIDIDRIPLPRYEKKLPIILSKTEVKALLEAPRNLRHRAMLATMYGAGLRVSEVTKLKISDLDRERRVIWVRGGKGQKDRQVILAEPLRGVLLQDRFKLAIRGEMREMPAFVLVPARSGLRLRAGECAAGEPALRCRGLRIVLNGLDGQASMPLFVNVLSDLVGQPVIDETKFRGAFRCSSPLDAGWKYAGRPFRRFSAAAGRRCSVVLYRDGGTTRYRGGIPQGVSRNTDRRARGKTIGQLAFQGCLAFIYRLPAVT